MPILRLLKYDRWIIYPLCQTCCGQPMANSGYEHLAQSCNQLFVKNFDNYDKNEMAAKNIRSKIYELTEFLTDVQDVRNRNLP